MFARNFGKTLVAIVAMAASVSPLQARDAAPVVLEPISHWQLDMAENKCRIARFFGDEADKTVFFLEQWSPSQLASWTAAGGPLRKFRAGRETSFAFGPGGDSAEFRSIGATLGDYGNSVGHDTTIALYELSEAEKNGEALDYDRNPRGLPLLDSEGAKGLDTLTIAQRGRDGVVLALGDLSAPVAAMNACMTDLVSHWGFDLEEQKSVAHPAEIRNLKEVSRLVERHYPFAAESKGAQADFHLRLTVGSTGAIEDCVLLNTTVAEDFEMRRHPCVQFTNFAEAEPARTAEGKPVRTYYTARIMYRMGGL